MPAINETEKLAFKDTMADIFSALNSVTLKSRTACTCKDDYGVFDPECKTCNGTGYTEKSKTIAADVQEITGDERIAIEAGILKRGDLVIRTLIDNQVQVGDTITHSGKDYEVKFVRPDQIEAYLEIGCGKRV